MYGAFNVQKGGNSKGLFSHERRAERVSSGFEEISYRIAARRKRPRPKNELQVCTVGSIGIFEMHPANVDMHLGKPLILKEWVIGDRKRTQMKQVQRA